MANDASIREDELEAEFRRDRQAGLEFLELFFRKNILALIKSQCRFAQPQDWANIYQDAMVRVIRAVCKDDFDPERPMRLVQRIVVSTCIDFMRRKKLPTGDSIELGELLGGELWNAKPIREWKYMVKEDMPKFRRALDQAIEELPPKQKAAAMAMAMVCERVHDEGDFLALRDKIEEMTGEPLTTAKAKDNWRVAREKIAEKLERAGFNFLSEE